MKLMRQLLPSRHRRGTLYPVESFPAWRKMTSRWSCLEVA